MHCPFFFPHALSEFYVDGGSLPLVDFDVGPSWAGLIPISGAPNETRKVHFKLLGNSAGYFGSLAVLYVSQLFFWLFPPGPTGSLDDLIFWYVVYLDVGFRSLNECFQGLTEVLVARRWKVSSKKMV